MDDKKNTISRAHDTESDKQENTEKTVLRPTKNTDSPQQQPANEAQGNSETIMRPRRVVRVNADREVNTSSSIISSAWAESVKQGNVKRNVSVGSILNDRFELLEVIGHGGMGTVYKAIDRRDIEAQHRLFLAIKVLNDEFNNDADLLKALHGEARKTQQLAHPNIVTVFDFDRDGCIVFMTMEYIEGIPLDELIKNNPAGIGIKQTVLIVNQMASALSYAHSRHIIHSDFKPGNIFISPDNKIKVLDFGIARVAKSEQNSSGFDAGILGGLTPAYASPEMFNGEQPDPGDDVYALACVTYELLTGKHPYNRQGADVAIKAALQAKKINGLNARQWKAINKALAFQKKNRPDNVEQFIEGLNAGKSKLPVFLAVAGIALIAAAGTLKEPLLKQWNQYRLEQEIDQLALAMEQGDFATMLKALLLVTALPEMHSLRIKTEERIADEILKYIASGEHNFISQLLMNFDRLNDKLRKKIIFQAKGGLLAFYQKEMDIMLFSSETSGVYSSVESLLMHANELYPDSVKLGQIKDKKNDLIFDLDDRLSMVLKQKQMLADPASDDIVDVLTALIKINPAHPLVHDARVEAAYIREAEKALLNNQDQLAKQLVEQGKIFFSENIVLADLSDQVKQLEQLKQKKSSIDRLEKQIENLIDVFSSDIYIWLEQAKGVFEQLVLLQADSQLINRVSQHTENLLNKELEFLTAMGKWDQAYGIVSSAQPIISDKIFIDNNKKIDRLKQSFEKRLQGLFNTIDTLLANELTEKSVDQINGKFSELEKLLSESLSIQARKKKMASTILQRVDDLSAEWQWDKAFRYLGFAAKINPEKTFQQHVEQIKVKMTEARFAFEGMAKDERVLAKKVRAEQREKKREQLIKVEIEHFNQLIASMSATNENIFSAKLILDSISVIDPEHAILQSGPLQIEMVFVSNAEQLMLDKDWLSAGDVIKIALLNFSGSEKLKAMAVQVEKELKSEHKEQQQLEIARHKELFEQLLRNATEDSVWRDEIKNEFQILEKLVTANVRADLSKKEAEDKGWLNSKKAELVSVLTDHAEKRLSEKRLTGARNILMLGLEIDSNAKSLMLAVNKLEQQQALFERDKTEKQLTAEREGLKRSFEIQLKANKVKQALSTLNRLKKIKGVDKNYVNKLSLEMVADTYYRLANIQLEKGNQTLANTLAEKGLKYNKKHRYLQRLKFESKPLTQQIKKADSAKKIITSSTRATVIAEQGEQRSGRKNTKLKAGKACLAKNAGYGRRSKARCYDYISDSQKGPVLAVIPAGNGVSSFAIGIAEVSVKDYRFYCKLSGQCSHQAISNIPITAISLQQAKAYVQWLSNISGYDYRLPSKQQWLHAAKAGGSKPVTDFNCKLVSSGTVIKGQVLVSIQSGQKNAWGLRNMIGNAQEWVVDGNTTLAMGGAHSDMMTVCDIELQRTHSGQSDKITGFRVVRNIDN